MTTSLKYRRQIDDDVTDERADQLDQAHHLLARDLVGERRLGRCGQHQQPGRLVNRHQVSQEHRGRACRSGTMASTTVCWGWSFSMTATSPNWRWPSIRRHGTIRQRASAQATFVAITDLPEPPLVENTVMTSPGSPSIGSERSCRAGSPSVRGAARMPPSPSATRLTVSTSCIWSMGAGEDVLDAGPKRRVENARRQLAGHQDGLRPRGSSGSSVRPGQIGRVDARRSEDRPRSVTARTLLEIDRANRRGDALARVAEPGSRGPPGRCRPPPERRRWEGPCRFRPRRGQRSPCPRTRIRSRSRPSPKLSKSVKCSVIVKPPSSACGDRLGGAGRYCRRHRPPARRPGVQVGVRRVSSSAGSTIGQLQRRQCPGRIGRGNERQVDLIGPTQSAGRPRAERPA